MTIYMIHGKYFLPLNDGIREVSFSQVSDWEKQDIEIEILEGDLFD